MTVTELSAHLFESGSKQAKINRNIITREYLRNQHQVAKPETFKLMRARAMAILKDAGLKREIEQQAAKLYIDSFEKTFIQK